MRIQLTKKIVAATLPRDRPYEVRDALVRGLLLRVQPSGHRAWIVTWAHGKRRTLGSVEHVPLEQARDIARKVIAEYIQTGLPSIAKPELPKITLRTYLDNHYAPWVRTELKQADDALRRIEQAFADLLPMTMKDINAKVIERWWVTRLQDTVRPGAKHQHRIGSARMYEVPDHASLHTNNAFCRTTTTPLPAKPSRLAPALECLWQT